MARSEFTVIEANEGHAHRLAPRLRAADLDELKASCGLAPLLALLDSIRASSYARAALWGGEVGALFGVAPVEGHPHGLASVWMLASSLADEHPAAFLRMCRREKPALLEQAPILFNAIDARNTKSLRWARWLGFRVSDPVAYGVKGLPFFPVTLRR